MPYQPITEQTAQAVVQCRLNESRDNERLSSVAAFARQLYALGVTGRVYSAQTITNILKGKTFPNLKDVEGRPVDFSAVPARQRGRTSAAEGQSLLSRVQALEASVRRLESLQGGAP